MVLKAELGTLWVSFKLSTTKLYLASSFIFKVILFLCVRVHVHVHVHACVRACPVFRCLKTAEEGTKSLELEFRQS